MLDSLQIFRITYTPTHRLAYKLWLADTPPHSGHSAVITRDGALVVFRTYLWPLVFKRCESVYSDDATVPVDKYLGREGVVWRVYRCTFTTRADKAIISYVTGKNIRTRIIFGN